MQTRKSSCKVNTDTSSPIRILDLLKRVCSVKKLLERGPSEKSRLIYYVLTRYTQCIPGKMDVVYGSVLNTETTGGAAYNILGHTWHSALGIRSQSRDFLC